jgi:hypothetical protein
MVLERKRMLNVRVTDDEMRMLQELADVAGLGVSDTIRQLVRREHEAKVKPRRKAR